VTLDEGKWNLGVGDRIERSRIRESDL
jgi:hypothetical protein